MKPETYWKIRCELAEACIEESPCDPDIRPAQIEAHQKWEDFKKKPVPRCTLHTVLDGGNTCLKCGKKTLGST